MKITLEPSNPDGYHGTPTAQHKVQIDHPHDDISLNDVLELVTKALRGYGFHLEGLEVPEREHSDKKASK